MPLATDPNQKFKVVLDSDAEKPVGTRPYFKFRYMTGREWNQAGMKSDELKDAKAREVIADIYEQLIAGVVGWGNIIDLKTQKPIPFAAEDIDSVTTVPEAMELLAKYRNQGLEVPDLKNSDLPSDSDTAASAKTAEEK